jgi:hypothetical protein
MNWSVHSSGRPKALLLYKKNYGAALNGNGKGNVHVSSMIKQLIAPQTSGVNKYITSRS